MSWISYDAAGNRRDWQPPTEDAAAQRLAEAQAGRLRYCHDARAWFVWDGALWRRDRTGAATRLARDVARDLAREPGGRVVAAAGRTGFVDGTLRFAREEAALAVIAEAWDACPWLLGTPEGPVDLRSGGPAPADPADGIRRATRVAPAPPGAEATTWRRFLVETFGGDGELIGFLQRALGYALTGSSAERMILVGCGAGVGKTTLLSTMLHVMDDYACPAELAALTSAKGTAVPHGTRLVAVADAEGELGGRRLGLVTGGDALPGGTWAAPKILAMAGTPPRLSRGEATLRRRLRIIPFRHQPARPDRSLGDALQAEAPAILRWMIEGGLAWQENGLDPPPAVIEATAACLEETATLDAFLAERCECLSDDAATATASDLWRAWRAFAAAAGEPAGSQMLFAEALSNRGFTRDRTNTARFYRRIRLHEVTRDARDA